MILKGKGGIQYNLEQDSFAQGGEGQVFNIIGQPDKVAKLYKPGKISPDHERKLTIMVNSPPDAEVMTQIAWPIDVLYHNGAFVGFVMHKFKLNEDLNVIYEYGASAKYPNLSWGNKIRIAKNLCVVLDAVHRAGHICGDFNPRNINVDPNTGHITFVDTDSYHIIDGVNTYRCNVGMTEYLPQEIQKKMEIGLANATLPTFSEDTDNFALAVHIFQLLMNGVHPFACAVLPSQSSIVFPQPSDNITDGKCPFLQKISGITIPKFAPDINILPHEIKRLFELAFIQGHTNPSARPSAETWYYALDKLEKNLTKCSKITHHEYSNGLKNCPWCEVDSRFSSVVSNTSKPKLTQSTYKPPVAAPSYKPTSTSISTTKKQQPTSSYVGASNYTSTNYKKNNYTKKKWLITLWAILILAGIIGLYLLSCLPNETLFVGCCVVALIAGIVVGIIFVNNVFIDSGCLGYLITIVICYIIIALVLVLIMSGLQFVTGNTPTLIGYMVNGEDMYVGGIIQTYSGTYTTTSGSLSVDTEVGTGTVKITSCDHDGTISGTFSFIVGNASGEYYITGQVTSITEDKVKLIIYAGEWIRRPSNFVTLEDMEVTISDSYKFFSCPQYNMSWFAEVEETAPEELSVPIIKVASGVLSVECNSKFTQKVVFEIDGVEYTRDYALNYSDLFYGIEPGEHRVRAKATNSKDPSMNSEFSEIITVTKSENAQIEGVESNILTVSSSDDILLYKIYVDGNFHFATKEPTYDISEIGKSGKHSITVSVVRDSNNSIQSDPSESYEYVCLSEMNDISISEDTVSWNSVEGALGYEIYVDNIKSMTLGPETTSIDVVELYTLKRQISVSVKAIGNGDTVIDSPMSKAVAYTFTQNIIKTANDLQKLNNSADTFIIGSDIDLSSVENWTPIINFTGTLDGKGHSIKNLKINSSESNVGLFSILEGTVRNLKIEDANVTVTGRNENIAILCGKLNGVVENITTSGTIIADTGTNVGGIAGYVSNTGTYTIGGLENRADIAAIESVGGIFGSFNSVIDTYNDRESSFTSLKNSGTISGTGNYIGGICGYLSVNNKTNYSMTILATKLENTGAVCGKQYVGGVIGYGVTDSVKSEIKDSSNQSSVTAEAYVGCIAGKLVCFDLDNCTNDGSTLTISKYATIDGEKYAYAGGFVGYGYLASNCKNTVEIEYSQDGKYVGGIMGYSNLPDVYYEMKNLANSANVSGTHYVGGIFGGLSNTIDTYNDRESSFTSFKNSGDISGTGNYIGGICGYLYVNNKTNYGFSMLATELQNIGAVSGKQYVGGLIGYSETDSLNSKIKDSSNQSSITAEAYVGCIAGKLISVALDNCTNNGSTLTATKYVTVDGKKYAYVGGLVGFGHLAYNCKNSVDIQYSNKGMYVGGIMGYSNLPSVYYEMNNLENTANISGESYVGGIFGGLNNVLDSYNDYESSFQSFKNSGSVSGTGNYVGGICGYFSLNNKTNYSITLYATELENLGAVSGKQYVGGFVGYGETDSYQSKVKDSINQSSVSGEAYVGCAAGKLSHVGLDNCSNDGSKLTATKYVTLNGEKYAYVGGFVGYGFSIDNCKNTVEIKYTQAGKYVGGVMGYCELSGVYVERENLENTANISGAYCVGGIFGGLSNVVDSYNNYKSSFTSLKNSGKISGTGNYIGGICGYLSVNNKTNYTLTLYASELKNTGNISGKKYVGGIFGYASTDSSNSSVIDVTATGTVSGSSNYGKRYGYAENVKFE